MEDQIDVTAVSASPVAAPDNNDAILALLVSMQAQIAELKSRPPVVVAQSNGVPKNKQRQIPNPNVSYVLQTDVVAWGKVPMQEYELAKMVAELPVGVEISEAELFAHNEDRFLDYQSLATSVQDVNYLFKYYLNIRAGKVLGFVPRGFLTQITKSPVPTPRAA